MFDGKAFGAEMVEIVRDFVAAELDPLRAENKALAQANAALADRVAELEARAVVEPVKGDPGEDGRDGADCDMGQVESMLSDMVAHAVANIPSSEKGEDGRDGEVDMDAVREMVDEMTQQAVSEQVSAAIAALPPPQKGDAGADCDMDAVKRIIGEEVAVAVSTLPAPEKGVDGKDGVGLADALIDRDGGLVLTMTDGTTKVLGLVVGKDGVDGEDGKTGETFTLDDFDIEQISERAFKFKFTKGDACHSFEFALPVPVYRGVFKEGEAYVPGDMVTWGGSCWSAEVDTTKKPGETESGWRLAVKAGRPGKDADMNEVKALAAEQARNAVAALMKDVAK